MLVIAYFSMPQAVIPFPANPKSFFIALVPIIILMPLAFLALDISIRHPELLQQFIIRPVIETTVRFMKDMWKFCKQRIETQQPAFEDLEMTQLVAR